MRDFFPTIYLWFENLYGRNLSEYLWGFDCATQDFSNPLVYNQAGLFMLFSTLIMALLYYYAINHPRLNRWRHWLVALLTTSVINLIFAGGWVYSDFINDVIGDCLMYTRDGNNNIVSQLIYPSNCWMFGIANAIVSAGFFVIFSFICKWGSRNCKYSPF
ncbi:MAG: hypothetical protein LBC98_04730 [Prevotellaceae bacterium]|jgi:hypothetical protein|nr:hypothetical protein [Prevotellaceae bacterium]